MGAPKGNQHGVGHGRPPLPGCTNEELIQMGKDLLIWLEKEKDNEKIVHLSQWYSQIKGISRSDWAAIRQRDSFLQYYERAIEWMGVKTLLNKKLSDSYGNRFIAIYFKDVRDHERSSVEHKINHELDRKEEIASKSASYPGQERIDLIHKGVQADYIITKQAERIKELEEKVQEKV